MLEPAVYTCPDIARRFLAPVVVEHLRCHPKARVEIVLADRRVNLVEEGLDLTIRIGELDDSSMSVRKLGEVHTYYVASPALQPPVGQAVCAARVLPSSARTTAPR